MEAVGSFSGVYVAIDGKRAGIIWLSDSPKPGAIEAVQRLKQLGKRVIMLTGDSASAAQGTAAALGIHEFHAELLPEQKVEQVDAIIQNSDGKSKVVFVGDGINDAPALARAHVGVAMGALGSEAAVETADVVLMTDNPFAVVEAMETAGKTNRIVWQNINLALVVKVVVLLLGAVSAVSLWQAVFADVGVTILTVLNSMRIIRAVEGLKTL